MAGHSEQQLCSCWFVNPGVRITAIGVKLTPERWIPPGLGTRRERRLHTHANGQVPSATAASPGEFTGDRGSVITVLCVAETAPARDTERSRGLIKDWHGVNWGGVILSNGDISWLSNEKGERKPLYFQEKSLEK